MPQRKYIGTPEELQRIDRLFFYELKSIAEIKAITKLTSNRVNQFISEIIKNKQANHIEPEAVPAEPIDPCEFERVYSLNHVKSNFVLITNNKEILKLRSKLT